MSKQVFISHSSKDKPFVRKLATDIEKLKISVWLDEKKIKPGDSIPTAIGKGLKDSDFVIVVLSHNSTGSNWFNFECDIALMNSIANPDKKTIPILLDDCLIPEILKGLAYADFRSNYRQNLKNLLRAFS